MRRPCSPRRRDSGPATRASSRRACTSTSMRPERASRRVAAALTALRPGDSSGWRLLGQALAHQRSYDEAEAAYTRSFALRPDWTVLSDSQAGDQSAATMPAPAPHLRTLLERWPTPRRDVQARPGRRTPATTSRPSGATATSCPARLPCREGRSAIAFSTRCDTTRLIVPVPGGRAGIRPTPSRTPTSPTRCSVGPGRRGPRQLPRRPTAGRRPDRSRNRRHEVLETRARCLAQLGRGPEAVMAAHDALQEFPDNPQTRFVAALVYASPGRQLVPRLDREGARGERAGNLVRRPGVRPAARPNRLQAPRGAEDVARRVAPARRTSDRVTAPGRRRRLVRIVGTAGSASATTLPSAARSRML